MGTVAGALGLFDTLEVDGQRFGGAAPMWETVRVGGKRKRRCLWEDEDGGVCGKEMGNKKQSIESHWRTHTGERPFVCERLEGGEACGKAFGQAQHLRAHERTVHDKERNHVCERVLESGEVCGQAFGEAGILRKHERTVHDKEREHVCERLLESGEVCGQAFGEAGSLRVHKRTVHDKKREHVCERLLENGETCGKAFGQPGHLRHHEKTVHDKERNHVCERILENGEACGQAFGAAANLRKHERTVHDNERNHVCERLLENGKVCGQAFGQTQHLRAHERMVHDKERNHVCKRLLENGEACGQAFGKAGGLRQHEKTVHDNERKHVCKRLLESGEVCGKAFGEVGSLHTHEKTHDGVLQYPCPGATGLDSCPYGKSKHPKYDGLCVRCFVASFPHDRRAETARKYLHAKELAVRAFLEESFPQYRWVFDRACAVGCLVRPDAKAVLGRARLLIVEIDEHSHDTYVCAAERERERLLAKHAPRGAIVHLIRFNPDAYDCARTGQRVPSCFRYSKVEACVTVDPARADDWRARLAVLRATIQEIVDHQRENIAVPECVLLEERHKHLIPIELFYDDVRRKWPDGNAQRLAAHKRNAKLRAAAGPVGPAADPLPSDSDDDDEASSDGRSNS